MHRFTMFIVLAMGCSSDQKLADNLGPNGNPGTGDITGTTPNGGGGDGNGDDPGNGGSTDPTGDTPGGGDGSGSTPTDGYGNPVGDDDDGTVPTDTDLPEPGDTGLTDEEICNAAATLAGFLDPYQTPDDGRVLYCHALHLNDSDISSCLPHLNHGTDTFPTSGCDT